MKNGKIQRAVPSYPKAPLALYRYDALDLLSSYAQLDSNERQHFYREGRLVTETQGCEQISIVQHGDQLLAQQQRQNSGPATALLATDQQRSVLHSLQPKRTRPNAYSPYGHRPCASGLSSLLGFNGQRPDPVTGHYLLGNGYRAFNPVLMRFNSPDSVSPFGKGGLNAYAYCVGDPINRTDPEGNFSVLNLFIKMSAAVDFLSSGHSVKRVTNVTRLSEGIFAFEDTYKNKPRLSFQGHGGPDSDHMMFSRRRTINAKSLHDLAISKGYSFERYENIRTVMCYSGSDVHTSTGEMKPSFAQALSSITQRPVKGYKGVVMASKMERDYKRLQPGETSRVGYFHYVVKNKSMMPAGHDDYEPVTFNSRVRTST
ncbi:RHS repeat-associated core domain-containing protein [Rhodococcus sp. IEGM1300]